MSDIYYHNITRKKKQQIFNEKTTQLSFDVNKIRYSEVVENSKFVYNS